MNTVKPILRITTTQTVQWDVLACIGLRVDIMPALGDPLCSIGTGGKLLELGFRSRTLARLVAKMILNVLGLILRNLALIKPKKNAPKATAMMMSADDLSAFEDNSRFLL